MKHLEKLLEKKKKEGKELNPMHAASKMSMLQALKDEMSGMMKDDLQHPGMREVKVASNDAEGLKHGLDKAKELVDAHGSASEDEESPEHEASESPEMEAAEHEDGQEPSEYGDEEVKSEMDAYEADPSKENLDKLIACLQRKKAEQE